MHGEFGLLFLGKANSHDTAFLFSFLFCFVIVSLCAVFSCFHIVGCDAYTFTTDGYGIFYIQSWDCVTQFLFSFLFCFVFYPCVQCFRVSIPSAVMLTLLRQLDMRSLTYSHGTALPSGVFSFFFPPLYTVFNICIPSAVTLTRLRQMDMGSLTCAQIRARAVLAKEGQAHTKSAQLID